MFNGYSPHFVPYYGIVYDVWSSLTLMIHVEMYVFKLGNLLYLGKEFFVVDGVNWVIFYYTYRDIENSFNLNVEFLRALSFEYFLPLSWN